MTDLQTITTTPDFTQDLFKAYYCARKNKRNTYNQLKFELNYESNLLDLRDQILERRYKPLPEIAFIVNKPVKREIFAADFRDRVVHHLLFNYLNPIMEKYFINDCYSCRKSRGTSYGIKRVNGFMRGCSDNYTKDCYILKLDIQGYFMSMNKTILYQAIKGILCKDKSKNGKPPFDEELVGYFLRVIIFNDPTKSCRIKGGRNWDGLPKSKSLFYAQPNCGLPIGNLTSQLFGNVYLTCFDQFVKRCLAVRYYGRYVDDLVLIHQDEAYLRSLIPVVQNFLQLHLRLTLHPKKIYFQHYTKGFKFLGVVIKPFCVYISARVKGNFYAAIAKQNEVVEKGKPTGEEQKAFMSVMNSYLGIMKHYKTYKLRRHMLNKNLSPYWCNYVCLSGCYAKIIPRTGVDCR